jgi:hypothetical protein
MKGNIMRTKVVLILLVGLLTILVVSASLLAEQPYEPGKGRKPDREKPVRATDVELVKKIGLRGAKAKPPWAGGPPAGKGKGKVKQVATGILGSPSAGPKYAVVIGIADYPGEENDLKYCDDDATEMAIALTDIHDFDDVTVLTDLDATREAIITAIDFIPQDAGEIVFFFSGHGMRGNAEDGDGETIDEAIVAHDGTQIVPIWDGELQDAFAGFSTSRIIFIFDMCLAGGMESDLALPGRIIAAASSENSDSYETDALENGEFTYYFVDEGTLQGFANVHNYDGSWSFGQADWVTVEEAFDYANANCTLDKPSIEDGFEDDLLLKCDTFVICTIPLLVRVEALVVAEDYETNKVVLQEVDCGNIGKNPDGDSPCYNGCESLAVAVDFDVRLSPRLAKEADPAAPGYGFIKNWSVFIDGSNQIPGDGEYHDIAICVNAWDARPEGLEVGDTQVGTVTIIARPDI